MVKPNKITEEIIMTVEKICRFRDIIFVFIRIANFFRPLWCTRTFFPCSFFIR